MLMHGFSSTLAFSLNDVIQIVFLLIFVLSILGGWMGSANKKQKEIDERRRRRALEEQEEGGVSGTRIASSSGSSSTGSPSLDELAARRRAQLQELARRRQAAQRPAGSDAAPAPAQARPENLSTRELTERERARAAYEQRAEKLRQLRAQQQQPATRQRSQASAQAQRARQEAAQRAQQQARLEARRKAAAEAERQARLAKAAKESDDADSPYDRRDSATDTTSEGEAKQGRILADAGRRGKGVPAAGLGISTDRESLRRAFIMKEVLDKPIAMREIGDMDDPWS